MSHVDDAVQCLVDSEGRELGTVSIDEQEGCLVTGRFTPGPDYKRVEPLFREFADAVEEQALRQVDRLDAKIARLGLRLRPRQGLATVPIHDVQLWDDAQITYRIGEAPVAIAPP